MSLIRRCVKDPFSGLSHLVGSLLAVAALVALLVAADGKPRHTVAFSIYGTTLILLYLASGCMHSIRCTGRLEDWLLRFDFIGIYLLIAGTYTPVCIIALNGAWGWSIFALEWTFAAAGILLTVFGRHQSDWARVAIYMAMGWLAMAAMVPLLHVMPAGALGWLFAGGIIYSSGAVIYATNRPRLWPGTFGAHDLWHVFVLAGSACHFMMMLQFVARM